jgi:hypothetical protein
MKAPPVASFSNMLNASETIATNTCPNTEVNNSDWVADYFINKIETPKVAALIAVSNYSPPLLF